MHSFRKYNKYERSTYKSFNMFVHMLGSINFVFVIFKITIKYLQQPKHFELLK
jgi:hypothetical protein